MEVGHKFFSIYYLLLRPFRQSAALSSERIRLASSSSSSRPSSTSKKFNLAFEQSLLNQSNRVFTFLDYRSMKPVTLRSRDRSTPEVQPEKSWKNKSHISPLFSPLSRSHLLLRSSSLLALLSHTNRSTFPHLLFVESS